MRDYPDPINHHERMIERHKRRQREINRLTGLTSPARRKAAGQYWGSLAVDALPAGAVVATCLRDKLEDNAPHQ